MLKVLADILLGLDSGNLTMLMLLDLSAAFNSIDHNTVLRHLTTSYGLEGVVIDWFASYLSVRTQFVCTSASMSLSSPLAVVCGVPQGSILGPTLPRTGMGNRRLVRLVHG